MLPQPLIGRSPSVLLIRFLLASVNLPFIDQDERVALMLRFLRFMPRHLRFDDFVSVEDLP